MLKFFYLFLYLTKNVHVLQGSVFSRQVNILHLGYRLTLANSADNQHF